MVILRSGAVLGGDAAERERSDAGEGDSEDERDEAVDSACDESDDADDCELKEKFIQLRRNDPTVTALEVNFSDDDDYACGVDWERERDCIGENTHLKSLKIRHPFDENRIATFEAFYRAVARNRSIKCLSMSNGRIYIGELFTILSPFFEHNCNLRAIHLHSVGMDRRSTRLLVSALSRCNKTSLRTIKFDFIGMGNEEADNEGAVKVVTALAMHNNLRELYLSFGNTDTEGGWYDALAQLVRNPNSNLEDLYLYTNRIGDNGSAVLGDALVDNSALKKLSLNGNPPITSTGWMAFLRCLLNPNSTLEELNLSGNNIGDEVAAALAADLVNNTKLKTLDLSEIQSVSATGWNTFFNLLRNPNLPLEKLNLSASNIEDEGVASMVDALANMSSLKYLDLGDNENVTATGWRTLSTILRHPNCSVEEIVLDENFGSIDDEVAIAFANALANNTSLKELQLGSDIDEVTPRGWSALANVLCNKLSIDSIYASNHALQVVSFSESDLPSDLVSSLRLNKNNNKFEVTRLKIIHHHFSDGINNLQELLEMELKVVCHTIAWVGRDGTGFPLLYHLVRNTPSLFDSDSKAKAKGEGAKRKRIC